MPNLLNETGDKVNQYLEKLVKNSGGTITYTRLDRGCFTVNKGSTLVHVLVKDWKRRKPSCRMYILCCTRCGHNRRTCNQTIADELGNAFWKFLH